VNLLEKELTVREVAENYKGPGSLQERERPPLEVVTRELVKAEPLEKSKCVP
jgi:hypothetical protein